MLYVIPALVSYCQRPLEGTIGTNRIVVTDLANLRLNEMITSP